jgi:hypothetical protein
MGTSWQSRLTSKQNRLSQKMIDNGISLSGYTTDVIVINETLNAVQDVTSINVDNIGIINIVFPGLSSIPMRRFINPSGVSWTVAVDAKDGIEPFVCYAPISTVINQGSILLKFFENTAGSDPLILPLKIADILGSFGGRSIIWQQLNVVYYDTPINPQLYSYLISLASRRNLLGW